MSTLVVVNHLADALRARSWMLATAESCTGGLIAAACTELAGSSDWFERGFVTYSNAAKHQMLGVDEALIRTQGAVSEPVALAMAAGALARSSAQLVVSVTGIAGPGGGSADKPVGLVWMATAVRGGAAQASCFRFAGDRRAVREAAVNEALGLLLVQAR